MPPKEKKAVRKVKAKQVEGESPRNPPVDSSNPPLSEADVRRSRVSLGPETEASTMSVRELVRLRQRYEIPEEYVIRRPCSLERVVNPLPGFTAFYEDALEAGLRFPIFQFIINLLEKYDLAFTQFTPNALRNIIGFILHCHRCQVRYNVEIFVALFVLKPHPYDKGWYYFIPRQNKKILHGIPSTVHGWKKRYFFISVPQGVRTSWGEPKLNLAPELSSDDVGSYSKLLVTEAPRFADLLSDEALVKAGIRKIGRRSKMYL